MNSTAFAWRSLLRDLRAGELSVLLTAIIVAVSAMTAVGFFTDRVSRAVKSQASAVIAADLAVRSAAPIDNIWLDEARALGLDTAESVAFPTMVIKEASEESALAFIRAVSAAYPLKGEVMISDEMFAEVRVAASGPPAGKAWVEAGLFGRLDLEIGDVLLVGESRVTISNVLEYQPNKGFGGFSGLAPGMMVNIDDLAAMDVIKPGSRVTYQQLYAGEPAATAEFRKQLESGLGTGARVTGLEDAGEQITAAIDRAQRFLNLASLVTVILAAVATAMAARRYALRHLDTVALIKSMGATQSFIQNSTLFQLLLVILGTSLIGSILGFFAQSVLVSIAGELLKVELPPTSITAGILGIITAATITIGFALPHLLQLRTTSPLRVLRHDLPPPQLKAGITYGIALGALLAMIW